MQPVSIYSQSQVTQKLKDSIWKCISRWKLAIGIKQLNLQLEIVPKAGMQSLFTQKFKACVRRSVANKNQASSLSLFESCVNRVQSHSVSVVRVIILTSISYSMTENISPHRLEMYERLFRSGVDEAKKRIREFLMEKARSDLFGE